jgi:uncharacterized metal-binding protein YceD (DUF177 family)
MCERAAPASTAYPFCHNSLQSLIYPKTRENDATEIFRPSFSLYFVDNIDIFLRLMYFLSEKSRNFAAQSVDMSNLEDFKIDLLDLSDGTHVIDLELDDDYFEAIDAPVVRRGSLHTLLTVSRVENFFDLDFHTEGSIIIPCDLCLDDMEQAIATDNHLVVKLGKGYSEDDDLVTISEDEGILDVSWFIYEFIELNIPLRHVHAPGKCNPAMTKILEEHSAARSGDGDGEQAVDSRWEALLKLKK